MFPKSKRGVKDSKAVLRVSFDLQRPIARLRARSLLG
jgi:hypothetical protein